MALRPRLTTGLPVRIDVVDEAILVLNPTLVRVIRPGSASMSGIIELSPRRDAEQEVGRGGHRT
jgi:hypothetical protein